MGNQQLVAMSAGEARNKTERIKSNANLIMQDLADIHDREGWRSLGYASMTEYMTSEFPDMSRQRMQQKLQAGRAARNLYGEDATMVASERVLRPIAKSEFLDKPETQREIWNRAIELSPNGVPRGKDTQAAVDEWERKAAGPTFEQITKMVEGTSTISADEWEAMPDSFVAECYKQCYDTRVMVKGNEYEFGKRGVYVCTGCGYAYPPGRMAPEEEVEEEPHHKMAVHHSSASSEHYTPQVIIDCALACMEAIDLDPCSNEDGPPNVPAETHYTKADDGLALPWHGRVYMNPPYGREIGVWVEKLCLEHQSGNVTEAVALVPARTDTQWWIALRDFPVCLIEGRLTFIGNDDPAPFPSAVFYLGENIAAFHAAFFELGDIWQRIEPGMFGG